MTKRKMKKVMILFGKKRWGNRNAFTFEETQLYQHCYEHLYDLAKENGVDMYRASYRWFDFKKKNFKYAWTYKKGKWVGVRNIKPDLIYDKTKLHANSHYFKQKISKDFKIINSPELTYLLDNKFITSIIFSEYSKKHYKVKDVNDLRRVAKKIKGKKIVLKTAGGSGGKGVQIIDRNSLSKVKITPGLTAQEFIDSSKGVKGLVEGVHDLRLVYVDNDFMYAYFRIPKKGSLLANLSQGGSMITITKKDIPKSVEPIVECVQDRLESYYPKVYTIDLMFDEKQRPWIVELNSMPGLYFSPDQKKWMNKTYLKLIKMFKEN